MHLNAKDAFDDGFKTGKTWKESYRPGGPWHYGAHDWESKEVKAKAKHTQDMHKAWMQGFDAGLQKNPSNKIK